MSHKHEFDWGTHINESFTSYITRIEDQIDFCLKHQEDLQNIIPKVLEIFEDVIFHGVKREQLYYILRGFLHREPIIQDYRDLIEYVKQRLERKIHRHDLLVEKIKALKA